MGWFKSVIILLVLLSVGHGSAPMPPATALAPEMTTARINGRKLALEIASTPSRQYRGLSNRDSLCADCGMLFNFTDSGQKSFVMRDMRFPLDIIFIDNGVIKNIAADLPPEGDRPSQIYQSAGAADQVLELNGGYCARYNIRAGDRIEWPAD